MPWFRIFRIFLYGKMPATIPFANLESTLSDKETESSDSERISGRSKKTHWLNSQYEVNMEGAIAEADEGFNKVQETANERIRKLKESLDAEQKSDREAT